MVVWRFGLKFGNIFLIWKKWKIGWLERLEDETCLFLTGGSSGKVVDPLGHWIQQVYATAGAFCALVDGSLVTWGHPRYGGDGNAARNLRKVRLVHATSRAFAAVMADGQVTER